ncbi:MAG: S8 family serine peptidase, partial [Thermoanaerobaculia bacterium]
HRARPVRMFRSIDAYAVEMTAAEAEALRSKPGVRWVEPEYEAYLLRSRSTATTPRRAAEPARPATHDSISTAQSVPWGIDLVRAEELWAHTRGDTVRVGVVDTGIDFAHIDFRAVTSGRSRLMRRPPFGFDFVNNDTDPSDDLGHGTHVAGTIAAADNAYGVIGVAPEVELHALKVLGSDGKGTSTNVVRAIDWAIENDFDVLNFSLGFDSPPPGPIAVKEAVQRAVEAGIVLVAASGNDFEDGAVGLSYPAAFEDVISVGAIEEDESIATFSQRGTGLDVVAPGVGVLSVARVGTGLSATMIAEAVQISDVRPFIGSAIGEVTGEYVYCGIGKPDEFPSTTRGRIALIRRGELTFNEKVRNAKEAGATGVVIFNHSAFGVNGTLLRHDTSGAVLAEDAAYDWPVAVSILRDEGEALREAEPGLITIGVDDHSNWSWSNGTSMASPHVAGVAALLRALAPDATPAQIEIAINAGARDAGTPGWDETFGAGIVDAWGAAHALAPERVPATP